MNYFRLLLKQRKYDREAHGFKVQAHIKRGKSKRKVNLVQDAILGVVGPASIFFFFEFFIFTKFGIFQSFPIYRRDFELLLISVSQNSRPIRGDTESGAARARPRPMSNIPSRPFG